MLRIALPNKGRLVEETRTLFADAGLDLVAAGSRALTARINDRIQALFVRAQDIAEFVADGAADAGITGWDLVEESGRRLDAIVDLGFGRCRLVVAAREESGIDDVRRIPRGARVATPFPRLAVRYFDSLDLPVEIVPLSGAAEVAPHLGIADVVVDLTSTGSTLLANGLAELDTLMESSARLVARTRDANDPRVRAALEELATSLTSVLCARGRRYLMANVPRRALDDVMRVLPGLDGPTVVDILNGGEMVAVHAVVETSHVDSTVARLRDLGARGLLVTRIERLVP